MTTRPTVTVIMRAKNSDWVIGQALAGLFSQDYTNFRLMVVDSGSTDTTLDLVGRYPAEVVRIPPGDYFPGAVLNQAIEATDSEIVVFQNSDVVPLDQSALGNLIAAFDDPKVMAAFARQAPRPEADTWVRRDYALSFPAEGDCPNWITLSLPLAAMRRSAWERHPFTTDAWGSEDTEWGAWAMRAGIKVAYVPTSVVMHSHNYTLRQIYGRRFIEGEADAFIYRGHETPARSLARALGGVYHDVAPHLKRGDLAGLLASPARRAVSAIAYYRGHRHGESRIRRGDRNAAVGQRVVLDRHESVRSA